MQALGRGSLAFAFVVALVVAGCGPTSTSSPTSGGSTVPDAAGRPSAGPGAIPVIVDTDLAGDDVLALMVLLRDPGVDVRGVTIAGTGEVHCLPGIRNSRRLLAAFGRSDVPVACGRELPGPFGRSFPTEWRDGADGFYGVELPEVENESSRGEAAPELLVRLAAASDKPLTIVTLGPMTNVADAAALDPAFASRLAGIHAMAGTIDEAGNIDNGDTTPADGVEWNVGADPGAMAAVLALDVPITLVGLDATSDVPVPPDIVEQLASDHAAAGADIAYEMYARTPFLAAAGNSYWDPLAATTLTDPSIAGWEDLAVTIEPTGTSAGRLSRDPAGRPIRAAMSADRDGFMAAFLERIRSGEPRANPFTIAGSLEVRWDGMACEVAGDPPTSAGLTAITLVNTSEQEAGLAIGTAVSPKTWDDVIAFMSTVDFSVPNLVIPDWIVPVPVQLDAAPGARSTAIAEIPSGEVGILCGAGTFPDITFHDGGTFTING